MLEGYDLSKLYDKLNLTGRVTRVGRHAVSSGGCANVWEGDLVVESRVEKVAVKVIRQTGAGSNEKSLQRRLVREVRAWSKLHHRNVLPLLGFTYGFDSSSSLASLVSPWMPKGIATKYLEKRSASDRIRVLTGVADGLGYLHRHDVVHGDLKGANILIDEHNEPRLADFGLSKLVIEVNGDNGIPDTRTASVLGSVRWMARELFQGADISPSVTCESDVWAFGMTTVELFTGLVPYHHLKNDPAVIIAVHTGSLPHRPSPHSDLDDDLWDLCNDCWRGNPELRPSTRVIAKRLWELDLRCKLQSRRKRRSREPDSPDCENGELSSSSDERLRKSPKLSTLTELAEECFSPGTPRSISRALVRAPTSRSSTPRSSTMSSSGESLASSSSSSNGDLSELNPRRLFTTAHSESDVYTNLHAHHAERMRAARTYSEPAASTALARHQHGYSPEPSGLGLDVGLPTGANDFDRGVALTSPRYTNGNSSPRVTSNSLGPRTPCRAHFLENEITGYEPPSHYSYDDSHPSQWVAFYPPYTHTSTESGYQLQPGSDYPELVEMQAHAYPASSYSDFLALPPPNTDPSSALDFSPHETPLLSPSALGPVFSEAFYSDVLAEEPLSLFDEPPSHYTNPTVDFTSLQHGVISPALSDATPTDFLSRLHDPSRAPDPADSPVIRDFDSFDAFDELDEPTLGLSLFGGISDGAVDDNLYARRQYDTATPTQRTPRHSPGEFVFTLRSAPQSPCETPQQQMPPTPRLSPLLSSF